MTTKHYLKGIPYNLDDNTFNQQIRVFCHKVEPYHTFLTYWSKPKAGFRLNGSESVRKCKFDGEKDQFIIVSLSCL